MNRYLLIEPHYLCFILSEWKSTVYYTQVQYSDSIACVLNMMFISNHMTVALNWTVSPQLCDSFIKVLCVYANTDWPIWLEHVAYVNQEKNGCTYLRLAGLNVS